MRRPVRSWLAILLAACALVVGCQGPATPRSSDAQVQHGPTAAEEDGIARSVDNVAVKNFDKVVYRGRVDLSETIERIRAKVKYPHRNDGSVFGNREGLLPRRDRGYYREYVHPTEGIRGPGPQRIVVGRGGDWWYTADHYASFISLGQETD